MIASSYIVTVILICLIILSIPLLLNAEKSFLKSSQKKSQLKVQIDLLAAFSKMKSTDANFEKQMDIYKQAFLNGDSVAIDDAKSKSNEITNDIKSVINMQNIPHYHLTELQKILNDYSDYTAAANETYLSAASIQTIETMNTGIKDEMVKLIVVEKMLKTQFQDISFDFYNELEQEISAANNLK